MDSFLLLRVLTFMLQSTVWAHIASRVAYHRCNLLNNSIASNMLFIPLNLEKEEQKNREKMISISPRSKILKDQLS